jgi:16S rRNA (cytosine1402-N4)-methyltransferase
VADLLSLIEKTGAGRGRRHHPATLVFQALRIAVNDEQSALEEGLSQAVEALGEHGRLVTLAYHSLEDRLVKQRLRDEARGCVCPPGLPECRCGRQPRLRLLTRKVVRPSADELQANPRARSARLRAAERLPEVA